MTGSELDAALAGIGWSERRLARLRCCSQTLVRAWRQGLTPIPAEVATPLRALAAAHRRNPIPPQRDHYDHPEGQNGVSEQERTP